MGDNEAIVAETDPSAPAAHDPAATESDIRSSNLGSDGRGDLQAAEAEPEGTLEAVAVFTFAIAAARQFLKDCMTSHPRVTYKLGAKIKAGQVPGRDFTKVDCSDFIREAMRRATNLGGRFPDGSVVQHDWVRTHGFAPDTGANARNNDATVRIAFLSPGDTTSHIGHVVLIHGGTTLESHGGVGPDSRPWSNTGWQAKAKVFALGPAH